MAEKSKLTKNQEKAVAALVSEPGFSQAADKARVTEATLSKWLGQADFKKAYMDLRRKITLQAIAYMQMLAGESVTALREIMNDQDLPPAPRISAAKTILDMALKGLELEDVVVRLEDLEDARNID